MTPGAVSRVVRASHLRSTNRHPGEGRDPGPGSRAFPLASRASHFCFGKSGQSRCAGHDGLNDIVSFKLPLTLADRAPARTTRHIPAACSSLTLRAAFVVQIGSPCRFSRPSLVSNVRALLARSAARRGVMQRRWQCFDDGRPWPSSKREPTMCFVSPRAPDARSTRSFKRGERDAVGQVVFTARRA